MGKICFVIIYAILNLFMLDVMFEPWGDEVFFTEPSLNEGFTTKVYPPEASSISQLYGKGWLTINKWIFNVWGYNLTTMRLQSWFWGVSVIVLTGSGFLAMSYLFVRALHCGRPEMGIVLLVALGIYLIQKKKYFIAGSIAGLGLFWHVPSGMVAICGLLGFVLALE